MVELVVMVRLPWDILKSTELYEFYIISHLKKLFKKLYTLMVNHSNNVEKLEEMLHPSPH